MTYLVHFKTVCSLWEIDWWFYAEMTIEKKPPENSHETLESFRKFPLLFKHIVRHQFHGIPLKARKFISLQ